MPDSLMSEIKSPQQMQVELQEKVRIQMKIAEFKERKF